MSRFGAALLAALLALPAAGAAQTPARENQLAVEAGIISLGVSYARQVGASPLSVGGGVWGSWEPAGSFERHVWEPITLGFFGRYAPSPWLHADAGVTVGRYVSADDCSDCSGTLFGLRSELYVGHQLLSIGPWATVAVAGDGEGSEFGVLWGVQARTIIRWSR